jgi:uncharacterized membrane protein
MTEKPLKRRAYLVRVGMAHKRLMTCAAIGIIVMLVVPAALVTRVLIGWDTGVLAFIVSAAVLMSRCSSVEQMERNAAAQDEGAYAILLLTVASAMASIGAIFAELAVIEHSNPHYGIYGALAIGTIVLSWAFIHTIFALHYAHDFYGGRLRGGLKFPEDEHPDYWDFVYFAFVVGMTFQVSDVAVTQKSIRRMVVAHGVLSFFFSTAFIAMAVNIAAALIQK